MKILSQLAIFFFICLFSEWVTLLLPFSFPSSIVALLLLLLLLLIKVLHIQTIPPIKEVFHSHFFGATIGTSPHAIGTSKPIEMVEIQGAMSGISIGIAGIIPVLFSLFISL